MKNEQRIIEVKECVAEWETKSCICQSFKTYYLTQERRKFLKIFPYWKTIEVTEK